MKKLLILSFMLFSLNAKAGRWGNIPTSDLDFDFFEVKVEELLNDAITTAIMFDEEIINNGDTVEEMPTSRLRRALYDLSIGKSQELDKTFEFFMYNIKKDKPKYSDYNALMFGPLNEIDRAVGNFGDFSSALSYPVLTTAKAKREIMLPKKDGTLAKWESYLEDAEEVKRLAQESIYKVAKKVMTEGIGKVLK